MTLCLVGLRDNPLSIAPEAQGKALIAGLVPPHPRKATALQSDVQREFSG
ncbi:hypothetical protein SAMN04488074_103444 [Lentzea albidocapillata subsp. violacea]|uniref:Uncharacterized protein n=1 Tax=Lentzea albidocapillata subsp. violacea TaxID=128104 RepID=A0A1G8XEW3_9PSEU|nr:hypothetical protein SAMN04488074_103444 [Lentzea albidocapillata subsp. violacea]